MVIAFYVILIAVVVFSVSASAWAVRELCKKHLRYRDTLEEEEEE